MSVASGNMPDGTLTVDSEATIGDVIIDMWRARTWLAGGGIIALCLGLLFLSFAVPQYRVSMIVTPTMRAGTSDIAALFPDNANRAMEYVMQNFGPGDASDFMRFEAILDEPTVAKKLLHDKRIIDGISQSGRFRLSKAPDIENELQLSDWLKKQIKAETVVGTSLKSITIMHPDPEFAAYLLQRVYSATDSIIRQELLQKTSRRVIWLKKKIDDTAHPEHRKVLTDLLMDQEQIRMVLAVNEPHAASIAEPPSAGAKPYWPRKSLIMPSFVLIGMFLAYALFGLRRTAKS